MNTTDDFTEAARTEAARRADLAAEPLDFEHGLIMKDFLAGAEWARTLLAAQEPTDAEHRIARLEAQTDIRGRAVVIYRERAREAEAQIKAVRELHCSDGHDGTCGGLDSFESCVGCLEDYPCSTIRALESVPPPRA